MLCRNMAMHLILPLMHAYGILYSCKQSMPYIVTNKSHLAVLVHVKSTFESMTSSLYWKCRRCLRLAFSSFYNIGLAVI